MPTPTGISHRSAPLKPPVRLAHRMLLVPLALLSWVLLLPSAALAQSAPNVTIELQQVDPAGDTPLAPFTPVHGRITYTTDQPVRLVLHPYRDGQPVLDGVYYSGSPEFSAPGGEAIAWFGFSQPQQIDEIRAIANDHWGNEFARSSLFGSWAWRADGQRPDEASWIEPLKAQRDAVSSAQQAATSEGGAFEIVLMLLMQLLFLSVPASIALQVAALMLLRGAAGGIARLSALAMGLLWLFVIVTAVAGSNLSPIWLVFLSPLFVILLSVLLVRHRLARKRLDAR